MKDQIAAAVEEALAPLKQEIEALKAQLAVLAPLAAMAKSTKPPKQVLVAQEVVKTIPKEVMDVLKIVSVAFDHKFNAPWFIMGRMDGTTISVKKTEVDFRVRYRDEFGGLLTELTPSLNGLVAALKSLV